MSTIASAAVTAPPMKIATKLLSIGTDVPVIESAEEHGDKRGRSGASDRAGDRVHACGHTGFARVRPR